MTQSGVRTQSSRRAGTGNYNEILFEDKKGGELVSIHAEKDMVETVENNFTRSVGGGLYGRPQEGRQVEHDRLRRSLPDGPEGGHDGHR